MCFEYMNMCRRSNRVR